MYILIVVQDPCTIQLVSFGDWSDVEGVVDCPVAVVEKYSSNQALSFLQSLQMSDKLVM